MAKANVILLNSILWNLREVSDLVDKIKKHCGDVDCISWRYPLKSCSELKIFKLLQNNRNLDNYTFILELTYDRLLYLFNLIIKYLESVDSLEEFRPSKNVQRPKTLSLASVLHMIWERIQALTECIGRVVEAEKSSEAEGSEEELGCRDLAVSTSTTCTQSDVCSISLCSCCEMVQKFVTQLVLEMETILGKYDFESAISREREVMRECLSEMTSWSAMSRWLGAILTDFTALFDRIEQATTSSRKLRHRLNSGERKIKQRIEQHEEETRKLETRLREQETKITELEESLEEAIREKIQLNQELSAKSSELAASSSNFENEILNLKKSYEKKLMDKEKKKKKEREKEQELTKMLEVERKKLEEKDREKGELEDRVCKLEQELEGLKASQDKVKLEDLQSELEALEKNNVLLKSTLEEKEEKLKEYSTRIMEAFPELNDSSKKRYRETGNPEVDMSNQIEANKLRIQLLNTENENLQRTLEKIKSLKG